jgi:hypothetical protein
MAQPIRGWAVRAKQNTWFIALVHRSLLVRDVPRPNVRFESGPTNSQ